MHDVGVGQRLDASASRRACGGGRARAAALPRPFFSETTMAHASLACTRPDRATTIAQRRTIVEGTAPSSLYELLASSFNFFFLWKESSFSC
ncbi:hypothetical protein GQ55_9G400400 [Panicum hallii var. hallii]|uniref:Uncharacterized protein n=1 Tax=Panicum hallii var. hallii TaxID=1504633 RepID=A0A2T7CA47_9POAL|nr:hypothetical protein GQ55_9G400400 [Panicum hallii var. hallii]